MLQHIIIEQPLIILADKTQKSVKIVKLTNRKLWYSACLICFKLQKVLCPVINIIAWVLKFMPRVLSHLLTRWCFQIQTYCCTYNCYPYHYLINIVDPRNIHLDIYYLYLGNVSNVSWSQDEHPCTRHHIDGHDDLAINDKHLQWNLVFLVTPNLN